MASSTSFAFLLLLLRLVTKSYPQPNMQALLMPKATNLRESACPSRAARPSERGPPARTR
ncbi:hypothetical protein HPB50_021020 [Hyalomma asiaticum]|uniref:Uncharacterized protein n=1 Tax=Hyalomma asiaticum TaxID=266040 RepID=A0ACB7SPE9_HYAAI|nr:hypothetical protein HPB50_021020 [Hyalomma asiaticum]